MKKSYGVRETALMMGVKVRTIRDWIAKGKLKAHKAPNGRYWRVYEDDILEKLERAYDENENAKSAG